MPSRTAALLPPLLRALRLRRPYETGDAMRRRIEDTAVRPAAYGPPARLRRDVVVTVDHAPGWPVYRVAPRGATPGGHVVYSHGGTWVSQIHPLHWRLVARLAAESRVAVTVPIYPLAPAGTAAVVVPAIADLLADLAAEHGADRVVAAGDSAGGQIALSAAQVLRDRGLPPLRRTVLIAPALDAALDNPDIDAVERVDPWLARPGVRAALDLWRAGLPVDDPLVSPVRGDLTGLGPLLVFSGTRDITSPDTRLLVARARAAGVEVELHEEEGLVHVYPLLPVPEGRAARRLLVEALRA